MDLIRITEKIIIVNKTIQNKTLEIKNKKTGDVIIEDIDNFLK